MKYLRLLYDNIMQMATKKYAVYALAIVAFTESIFFPIPPDVMLIPMIIAKKTYAFLYALIASSMSVLGGLVGYAIGFYMFATAGEFIIGFYGLEQEFDTFAREYKESGGIIVFLFGFSPLPFKLITITSGMLHLNIFSFLLASALSRSLRMFALASVLYYFGDAIKNLLDKYFAIITFIVSVIIIGGVVAVKYVF